MVKTVTFWSQSTWKTWIAVFVQKRSNKLTGWWRDQQPCMWWHDKVYFGYTSIACEYNRIHLILSLVLTGCTGAGFGWFWLDVSMCFPFFRKQEESCSDDEEETNLGTGHGSTVSIPSLNVNIIVLIYWVLSSPVIGGFQGATKARKKQSISSGLLGWRREEISSNCHMVAWHSYTSLA